MKNSEIIKTSQKSGIQIWMRISGQSRCSQKAPCGTELFKAKGRKCKKKCEWKMWLNGIPELLSLLLLFQ